MHGFFIGRGFRIIRIVENGEIEAWKRGLSPVAASREIVGGDTRHELLVAGRYGAYGDCPYAVEAPLIAAAFETGAWQGACIRVKS